MCTPMNENWSNFLNKLSERLNKMLDYVEKNNSTLYETDIDKDELWEVYLSSFPEGTNKMYRKRREYDCGHCRNFIKTIGGAVAIVDGKIHTIWEIDTEDAVFQPVVDALRTYVESKPIKDIWRHLQIQLVQKPQMSIQKISRLSNGLICIHRFQRGYWKGNLIFLQLKQK